MRAIEVLWKDANTASGWLTREEALATLPQLCRSIGYLLLQDKEQLIIVQSVQEGNEDVGDALCLPIDSVLDIKDLT